MTEPSRDADRPVHVLFLGRWPTAQDFADPLRRVAAILRRRYRIQFSLRRLWAAIGQKNPARVKGSRAAGEAVAVRMTKTQRQSRATAGGLALMHGSKGTHDPTHARLVARALQRLQAKTRRGEHTPVKEHRSDRSRSDLSPR